MKTLSILLVFTSLLCACSSPKKAPARKLPSISKEDLLRGGTSFASAIVILLDTERGVLDEEYRWLSINYPGYSLGKRSHTVHLSKNYDIVRIKTRQQQVRDIYFDCSVYWNRLNAKKQ